MPVRNAGVRYRDAATKEEEPVEIVQAYLKGTQPFASLVSPLVAAKQFSAVMQTLNFTVTPVVGQTGKLYEGRIVVVDKHGNKYKSPRLKFAYRESAKEQASVQN